MNKSDISFMSDSTRCAGWFYLADVDGPAPCIVMAHGLAGVKEMRLDAYAERFAAQGYHVLVFDYRHFGASEGSPRQLLDIGKQHGDWTAAVGYARSRHEVDPSGIVLWGSSLSGGHVMAMAESLRAAAVIAQIPHTDGFASVRALGPSQALKLTGHGLYDAARALLRLSPHYVNASGEPGSPALMTAPEARGYLHLVPVGHHFDERVAARFALAVGLYSPGRKTRTLAVPILVQVASKDQTTPPAAAIKAARQTPFGVLKAYDIGHFEPYVDPAFNGIVGDQLEFLQVALERRTGLPDSRTVVITGAAAGIGRAAARRFAALGWTLCVTDVNSAALQSLREELGDRHTYATMNVTDKDDVSRVLADFAAKHGGSFDLLLNNAGVAFLGDFEARTLEQHELVTGVNVNGVLNCTYLAFPYLSKAEEAKVINMCSAAAEYGLPSEASYSASKFWVRGFTEAMNIEWEQHGIHVCDIMPNFVATPMMDIAHTELVNSVGVKLTADDVADTITKAAGDRTRVHWKVDTTKGTILRAINNRCPAPIRRSLIKRLAGY
ncbi:SDR family oxidoreductase [Mycobacteroides abscessus]|uniref:SDR family oxidoreductase n=1 Tax=Mycobacteroides abscessus TaxID=36809 RepID=A0ABD7HQ30_9MYCO|nr:SDR family oxidoreductase [Mycobacteroides abscessus]AWG62980.1 short-chain dehydrogenase [Mycobacteroides abscessus]PVA29579.1 short-chain dehydrogenase [Mycobacteroides abscessus]PVA43486.1 short-chain dehydrogenase [Mycobacteroides abscessus]PVA73561.1 short-chain dehydrogenase [Mycobacteroides abscessus]PVB12099.1 short-chain dehydrogenase [Mycobacteroides abscessus]